MKEELVNFAILKASLSRDIICFMSGKASTRHEREDEGVKMELL